MGLDVGCQRTRLEDAMTETIVRHKVPLLALTPEAFAPYGQIVFTRKTGNQFDGNTYSASENPLEAQLVLNQGTPRLWIMHQFRRGRRFHNLARHRRVTQCLGALEGKEWFMAFAPPQDLADDARPRLEDVVGFRIPGDAIIKLHIATWHAGPHFDHDECRFINLENMDTNQHDFQAIDLPVECELVD